MPAQTPASAPVASASSAQTVTFSLKEYSITPSSATIKVGTPVTFLARNDGTISHALAISGQGISLATKDLSFQPGTSESITGTLAAGTYTFLCPVDEHAGQGMTGTLTVTP